MLYSFELMNKVCNDVLPLCKDINNLISEYILTSDHVDFMLFKKIDCAEEKARWYLYQQKEHTKKIRKYVASRRTKTEEEKQNMKILFRELEMLPSKIKINFNYIKKLKYTTDKGNDCDFNYFKIKSKIEEKVETTEALKYINYLYTE